MDRIACAYVARFELALAARRDTGLWRRPVAIADLSGPGRLGAVTPVAEALGIQPGQLASSARARLPELEILAPDLEAVREGEREILGVLGLLSPNLDSDGRGAFFLGLAGLERLYAGERALCTRVRESLVALDLDAQVAVADSAFTAWIAARRARPIHLVEPGSDQKLLGDVPITELARTVLSERAQELFGLLGLERVSELAQLPPGELARRLGGEGSEIERMLRGEKPLAWPQPGKMPRQPERIEVELDEPVDDLEPLLFLGKSLIDRLLAGLHVQKRALVEMSIELTLDDRSIVEHVIRPADPTVQTRPVLDLYRLWLEQRPLASGISAIRLCATLDQIATSKQLSLYRQREQKEAQALGQAVARLRAAFGPNCAVRPVLLDTFRPEARLGWESFEVTEGELPSLTLPPKGGRERTQAASDCANSLSPLAGGGSGWGEAKRPMPLVLRLFDPAQPVEWRRGQLRLPDRPYLPIISRDGPHRVASGWWASDSEHFDRSYFWLTLEDGTLCWVYFDHLSKQAYLHGVAD